MKGYFWTGFFAGALVALLVMILVHKTPVEGVRTVTHSDTVVVRDTVRVETPRPYAVTTVRVDTVRVTTVRVDTVQGLRKQDRLRVLRDAADSASARAASKMETGSYNGDTARARAVIPIERKEYRTDDYRAVVEGYRVQLVSMETYPKTTVITNTERVTTTKKRRIGVGVQAGYGFNGTKFAPYVGVGVQWNVW
jgi:hypothetical protein